MLTVDQASRYVNEKERNQEKSRNHIYDFLHDIYHGGSGVRSGKCDVVFKTFKLVLQSASQRHRLGSLRRRNDGLHGKR